jgi:hypothetical protein
MDYFDNEMNIVSNITPHKIMKMNNDIALQELQNRLKENLIFALEQRDKYARYVSRINRRLEAVKKSFEYNEEDDDE